MPSNSRNTNSKLSFTRKILAIGLGVFALALLVGWFWQLNNTFSASMTPGTQEGNNSASCADGGCGKGEVADKNKDTDGDGLSDWEERNVYNTSPYLKDTDSDGLTDKEEVEQGTDPNCPQGKECSGKLDNPDEQGEESLSEKEGVQAGVNATSQQGISTENATSGQNMLPQQNVSVENVDREELQKMLQGEVDASSLRSILKEAGMSEEKLGEMSDEQLMQSYQQSLEQMRSNSDSQ